MSSLNGQRRVNYIELEQGSTLQGFDYYANKTSAEMWSPLTQAFKAVVGLSSVQPEYMQET